LRRGRKRLQRRRIGRKGREKGKERALHASHFCPLIPLFVADKEKKRKRV